MDVRGIRDDEDATLAARIATPGAARDGAAEAELCRRLAPRIRLYGLKHLRNDAAARDLAQDVLLLLLDKLRAGALRDPSMVASFALGTARQMVVDGRRGERRREQLLETFAIDLQPAMEEAVAPIDDARLRHCLQALPERERSVIVMTFYEDHAAEQVATDLGLTAGNVRVIRHRGLVRLRDCMQGAEGRA
jgi:RNA polymerase sigma-70 factor (ECF subfamily)